VRYVVTKIVREALTHNDYDPAHQGHARTGLNRKCAAVCMWVARIRHTEIRDVAGVVPGTVMLEIFSKVTTLLSPPSDPPAEAGGQSAGGSSI
jgi:hypothetical protein